MDSSNMPATEWQCHIACTCWQLAGVKWCKYGLHGQAWMQMALQKKRAKDSPCYQNPSSSQHTKYGKKRQWQIIAKFTTEIMWDSPVIAGICRVRLPKATPMRNEENKDGTSFQLADRSNQNHRMMLLLFRLMINVSKRSLATQPKDVLASWI